MLYEKPGYVEALAEDEQKAMFAEYTALAEDPRGRGGAPLQPIETATTVRVQDGQTLITDGPYADTKEVFGGYHVFEADNLDEAIELAARIPAARLGNRLCIPFPPEIEQECRQRAANSAHIPSQTQTTSVRGAV